ncbi:MAG: acyl-CoA dehydrogenase family protein, partial [Syntrophales bacterium]|nr:acyl-CoA dehydrogenase family protein [Syntrophales bacterium]
MDFKFGEKEEQLRREVCKFAKDELPPDWLSANCLEEENRDEDWEFGLSISKKLAKKGWLTMSWPVEYCGKGASLWEQFVYCEEAAYWGIPGVTMGVSGVDWVGPSIMLFGSEELKKEHLPLIA